MDAGTAVASAYIEDIARYQAHRFVSGIAPIKSICRVSTAAAQLLAIPRQQLYRRSSGGEPAGARPLHTGGGDHNGREWAGDANLLRRNINGPKSNGSVPRTEWLTASGACM